MSNAREQLFDEWAESYDKSVDGYSGFPFEGYADVLDVVAEQAQVGAGMELLDVGIGTGNLVARFLDSGCAMCGMDFSLRMLTRVRARYPQIELVKADLKGDWPIDVDRRFDRVVSAYVLHEFDLDSKVRLLGRFVRGHLADGGRVVVGDISFPSRKSRAEAEKRFGSVWDEDEYYWAADEAIEALAGVGLTACYSQVSFCGGVYVVERGRAECRGAAAGGGKR